MSRLRRAASLALGLSLFIACAASYAAAQAQTRPSARAIISRMARTYAQCSSYQDEGIVESAHHEGMGGRIEKMPFKLYFARPNLVRVEWTDYFPWKDGRLSVVWSNGRESFTYWQPDRFEKEESLDMMLAGATGVSSGAARTVPRLLMPGLGGFALTDLTGLSVVGEELFEGESCYVLTAAPSTGGIEYEMWVGKRDYLLRKVRQRMQFEDYYVIEDEIHRDIKINRTIARATFDFKPPIPLSTAKEKQPEAGAETEGRLRADENPNWAEFHSEEGRFKILLPSKPTTQTVTMQTPQGQTVQHIFQAGGVGNRYLVSYTDLPVEKLDEATRNELFDKSRDELLKAVEGKLGGETGISAEGHAGREVKINLRGGEARARLFVVERRFYVLLAFRLSLLSELHDEPESFGKFFDSFKLVAARKQVAALL